MGRTTPTRLAGEYEIAPWMPRLPKTPPRDESEAGQAWAAEQFYVGLRVPQALPNYEVPLAMSQRAALRVLAMAERRLAKQPIARWRAARASARELLWTATAALVRPREKLRDAWQRRDPRAVLDSVLPLWLGSLASTAAVSRVARLAVTTQRPKLLALIESRLKNAAPASVQEDTMAVDVFWRRYNRDPRRMMSAHNVAEARLTVPSGASLADILAAAAERGISRHRQIGIFQIQTDRGTYWSSDGLALDPTTRTGRSRVRYMTWEELDEADARGESPDFPTIAEHDPNQAFVKGLGYLPLRLAGDLQPGDVVYRPKSGARDTVVSVSVISPKMVEVLFHGWAGLQRFKRTAQFGWAGNTSEAIAA